MRCGRRRLGRGMRCGEEEGCLRRDMSSCYTGGTDRPAAAAAGRRAAPPGCSAAAEEEAEEEEAEEEAAAARGRSRAGTAAMFPCQGC